MKINIFLSNVLIFLTNNIFVNCNSIIIEDVRELHFGNDMRDFIKEIIKQSCKVIPKNGFIFWIINDIRSDMNNFMIKEYFSKISGQVVHMGSPYTEEQLIRWSDTSGFTITILNPNVPTSEALASLTKFRKFRTTTVLIFLEPPMDFYVKVIFDLFKSTKCYNTLIVYENVKTGIAELLTLEPSGRHSSRRITEEKYKTDLFADKLKNMHGSKIRALLTHKDQSKIRIERIDNKTISYSGKDYDIIKTMLDKIDAKLEILDVNEITEVNPFSFGQNNTKMKTELFKKHDISFMITSDMFLDDNTFENIYPHTTNDFMVVIPSKHARTIIKSILKMYDVDVWIFYALAPVSLIFISVIIRRVVRQPLTAWNLCINVYSATITNQIWTFPITSLGKTIFLGWNFYFYVQNMYAQSKITSVLTRMTYDAETDKIGELLRLEDLKDVYVLDRDVSELTKALTDKKYENFVRNLKTVESSLEHMNISQKMSFILQQDQATYLARGRAFYKEGKPNFHIVKESIMPSYQTFKIVFGSPLLPIMNKLMRRLLEGGIIDYLSKKSLYEDAVKKILYPPNYDDTDYYFRTLTLKDVDFAFNFLALGLFVSFVAFTVEILIGIILKK